MSKEMHSTLYVCHDKRETVITRDSGGEFDESHWYEFHVCHVPDFLKHFSEVQRYLELISNKYDTLAAYREGK